MQQEGPKLRVTMGLISLKSSPIDSFLSYLVRAWVGHACEDEAGFSKVNFWRGEVYVWLGEAAFK